MLRDLNLPSRDRPVHGIRSISAFQSHHIHQRRTAATAQAMAKRAGDISDAFVSLSSDSSSVPLEPRFAALKKRLVSGHEDKLEKAWLRLLDYLRAEVAVINTLKSRVVPEI